MKRDMDLIKTLLLSLEENDTLGEIEGYSNQQVRYHAALLQDAGLITHEGYYNTDLSAAMLLGTRMTWSGHEFLDAARNKSFWERAKRITLEKTGSLTFEVLKTVLIQLGKEAIANAS
jgi:hypothetical protein